MEKVFLLCALALVLPAVPAKQFNCMLERDMSCTISGAKLSMDELPGSTFAAINPSLVKRMQFSRSSISALPATAFDAFPKLETLNASGSDLKQILPNTFGTAKVLQELYLGKNVLHSLPEDAFYGANRLKTLDLSDNSIATIEGSAFRRLRELKTLLLGGNHLGALPSALFNDLSELETLELQQNNLVAIDDQLLEGCTSLTKLNVSHNALKALRMEQFERRWSFDVIDASYNSLDTVKIPSNLRQLVATGNGIRTVQLNGVSSELILLKVPHNKLDSVDGLPTLEKLISLDLSFNHIRTFDFNSIARFGKLILLKLDGNQLQSVSNSLTGPITHLKYVHLAHNQLVRFDLNVLATVPRIIKLDLSRNQIESLSVKDLSESFPVLVRLLLEGNNLRCDDNRKFVKELKSSITAYAQTRNECRKEQKLVDGLCCS
ncbi:carboxypeptidase N subunit 2-like [Anopheles cruzii]|uniref:carboxypeptidase N subunit 2-like n=1 Tax=Anopheles cruzii TaxID=68878 RepID=UPI0022EC2E03|nr:carboxypeptidase N subunit 2-like [Anopheles cruzii]